MVSRTKYGRNAAAQKLSPGSYRLTISQHEAVLAWSDKNGSHDELKCSLRWLLEAMYGSATAGFGPLPEGLRYISPQRDVVIIEQPPGPVSLQVGKLGSFKVYVPWVVSVYYLSAPVEFDDYINKGATKDVSKVVHVSSAQHFFSIDPIYTDGALLRHCALPLPTELDEEVDLFDAFSAVRKHGGTAEMEWDKVLTQGIAATLDIELEWKEKLYETDPAQWQRMFINGWANNIDSVMSAMDVVWPSTGITVGDLISTIETASMENLFEGNGDDYADFFRFLHPLFTKAEELRADHRRKHAGTMDKTYQLRYQ